MFNLKPDNEENYLNATDDGEPSKKSHSASNETELGFKLDLLVPLDVFKGGRVKVDLDQLKGRFRQLFST